ncbi:ABC transporter permease [Mucilaginibacter sp.]|jgi:ABC-type antimicrobial peptide transport system permease subunit|uniref:ABC transporter permease n=1 Tax=Mucilaginibacter sp. TaxID=1882438 RepID=UPI002C3DC198|nr:ABC transporter permease [Mucilaginibacter sp.]HTI59877.1 ABC transporter permease [Mucilaginibacter sp.]
MIRNYLKIAWRNILSNKIYSALNILGLAAGMAVALIIALWVEYQYSFDKALPNYEQLYQVRRNFNSNGETLTFSTTSLKLADALRNSIPEIEYVAESDWMGSHGLMVGNKKFYMDGAQIGGDFLKMFQYPLVDGNANTALHDAYSIVLTQSTAKALFGDENPVDKTVRVDNQHDLKVTGVLKDLPPNSSFQFKYLIPFSYLEQTQDWVKRSRAGSFDNNGFQQFIKLKPGTSYAQVAAKIRDIEKNGEPRNTNAKNSSVIIQPLKDWHLYNEYKNGVANSGFIDYVRIFSLIGVLVLLIAGINFVNLSTARSEKRAKEVGVRKAIGSQRKDLIFQFLTESTLITVISFFFCLLFVQLALPAFNLLASTSISVPFGNVVFWLAMTGCVLITGLLAGAKPALYLSSFNPVKVLKGTISGGKSNSLSRRVLVIVQFSCSIALIISTVIIYNQIQYAKDRPTGYNTNNLMATDMNDDLGRNYVALKNELLRSGLVQSVTTASTPATAVNSHGDITYWPGKNPGETVEMGYVGISDDYFKTLGMQMKEGRNFFPNSKADTNSVIINEAAVKRLRLKDPLNQALTFDKLPIKIIGVVKDALMISPFAAADPTVFYVGGSGNLIYRLAPNQNTHDAVTKLTAIFNKYNPAFPYTYRFVDDDYNQKFNLEVLIGKLAGIFAALAIFISCLGLFGLAAYVAEQRTKEIGIRKVLGATVGQVWVLLSKDFVMLVVISCVVASPIAYYFLQNWLMKYEYHIKISSGVFIVSAMGAIVITLATISFQAIKAALVNPVKSLKSE